MTARAVLASLRPQEWVKNLLVYAGLLFSGQVDEGAQVLAATLTFVAFCAISSAGYLFNDLHDREHDRLHPEKRTRPIASGALTVAAAAAIAAALALAAVATGLVVEPEVGGLVALYGVITAAYSAVLKRLVILDVMTIASLFILRVVAGAVAVEATASEFLLICTAMLALFLGFTKRRQEAILELPGTSSAPRPGVPGSAGEASSAPRSGVAAGADEPDAQVTRPVLEHYSLPFLDQMIAMVTAAAILSYVIYAVDSPLAGSKMLATAPSVLYGIFRYLYLIYDRRDTRSTAAILTEDPGMVFAAVTWIGTALAVIYVFD
ncbi:MAG TPA: UbiA family prenyltransferase [Solirubrobacterales bacterium]|nr:UbiA family prenyltransferase [Solirubrobacterales bacterium]